MTRSAGILLHRAGPDGPEVLLAHMGGPFWASKDAGAWSIPKGEFDPAAETARAAAFREFREELGVAPPPGDYLELGTFSYASGKRVVVFAADGSAFPLVGLRFGEFEVEWPPRSGRRRSFPEVDRVEWTGLDGARPRLVQGQRAIVEALERHLASGGA